MQAKWGSLPLLPSTSCQKQHMITQASGEMRAAPPPACAHLHCVPPRVLQQRLCVSCCWQAAALEHLYDDAGRASSWRHTPPTGAHKPCRCCRVTDCKQLPANHDQPVPLAQPVCTAALAPKLHGVQPTHLYASLTSTTFPSTEIGHHLGAAAPAAATADLREWRLAALAGACASPAFALTNSAAPGGSNHMRAQNSCTAGGSSPCREPGSH